jgi:cysteine desulfurase
VSNYLFFDSASTTKCCEAAVQLVQRYTNEDFGNPSSNHIYGQKAARAIREARNFFADTFQVAPEQVVFTGSGSESNNFAIYGVVTAALAQRRLSHAPASLLPLRVLTSGIEHPAVKKTVESLDAFGVESHWVPVDPQGQLLRERYLELLSSNTLLISIHQVNNIVGAVLPVEELAQIAKTKLPQVIFHTDAIQAFGKIKVPHSPSPVDLVSISGHKIGGPKGVGALVILNKKLLQTGLRPLIWGGEQENGFRSGTQNAGLIAGFHAAAKEILARQKKNLDHVSQLRIQFREILLRRELLSADPSTSKISWNSPEGASPFIISLSVPGFPSGPLANLLEERGCIVSVGSACHSKKTEPDPVLKAMGFAPSLQTSPLRISLSPDIEFSHLEILAEALDDSIQRMGNLLGKSQRKKKP